MLTCSNVQHHNVGLDKCHCQASLKGNPIVAIFQCPGFWEDKVGAPAAGITGYNLCKVFECLRRLIQNDDELPAGIEKRHLYKCRIKVTNANDKVHGSNDRKSIIRKEMLETMNLKRLQDEIDDARLVLCFGDLASEAYDSVMGHWKQEQQSRQIVIKTYHLSPKVFRLIDTMCSKQNRSPISYDMKISIFAEYIYERLRNGGGKTFEGFRKYIQEKIKVI